MKTQLSKYPKLRQLFVPKQYKIQQRLKKSIYTNTIVVKIIKHIHHHNEISNHTRLRDCARMFTRIHKNNGGKSLRLRRTSSLWLRVHYFAWSFTSFSLNAWFSKVTTFTRSHIQMPRINFVFHQKHHIRAWLGLQQIFVFLDNQNHPKFKESNKCARFDISLLFCFHGHFVSILFFVSFFNFWESCLFWCAQMIYIDMCWNDDVPLLFWIKSFKLWTCHKTSEHKNRILAWWEFFGIGNRE